MLSRNEKGNLARLKKCVKPNQDKINRLKTKMVTAVTAWDNEITILEEENASYNRMIAELEARDTEETTATSPVENEEAAPETTEEIVEDSSFLPEEAGLDTDPIFPTED